MQEFLLDLGTGDCVPTTKERLEALERTVAELNPPPAPTRVKRASIFHWIWKERNWFIPTLFALLVGLLIPFSYHVAGLEIDKHIDTKLPVALAPIRDDISHIQNNVQQLTKDVGELKGIVEGPALAKKFSRLSPDELKEKKPELQAIKNGLANAPKDAPNFWPTSFQVINLLSQAMWQLQTIGTQPMTEIKNIAIRGVGRGGLIEGRNVLLSGTVEGFTVENSVVHFDASTRLINVVFIHCVFVFPEQTTPPPVLQQIGSALLASDLNRVTITAKG
jgi:hypothetical protein